jgi:hypothetical protein
MSRCPSFGIAWRTQNEVMGVVVIHTPFADSGSATQSLRATRSGLKQLHLAAGRARRAEERVIQWR